MQEVSPTSQDAPAAPDSGSGTGSQRSLRDDVRLRPLGEGESAPETASAYDDWGPLPDPPHAQLSGRLVVECGGEVVGDMTWHEVHYGPNDGSLAWDIGIGLVESARGRGIGSTAQRLLADHLFATTRMHRVQASTDVSNLAEQRALERAGFVREGVLRSAQHRADGRHDLMIFSRLRDDR
jgi:RimJ/RimL family protein N-acetyltransferase